jgi:hypothetical protein
LEKRYQVFISSTSVDLGRERRAVIEALYEASYFPVGMEFFNAATEAAWPTIKRIIDSCDYYVVISAGRYGSLRPNGVSFTESEYDYATGIGKPRLAFVYKDLELLAKKKTEPTEDGQIKVERFRQKLMSDLLCRKWRGGQELARQVVGALNSETQRNPQAGWIRADSPEALPAALMEGLIKPSNELGISRISSDGQAGPALSSNIADARAIAIMSTSGDRIIEIQKPYLIEAVLSGSQIRVLVPERDGAFIHDVEESEQRLPERDSISDEIRRVKRRLGEVLTEANQSARLNPESSIVGSIQMGSFSTHLRSTMILCDDAWGWVTMTLPPARAAETPSFELTNSGRRPLMRVCLRHFNRTWQVVEQRQQVETIEPFSE